MEYIKRWSTCKKKILHSLRYWTHNPLFWWASLFSQVGLLYHQWVPFKGKASSASPSFLRVVLRLYRLVPTQFVLNTWGLVSGDLFLVEGDFSRWGHVSLHFLNHFSARVLGKGVFKEWYFLCLWGSHSSFVIGLSSSIKGWKEMWLKVKEKWQVCEGDTVTHVTVLTSYSEAHELSLCYRF